MYADGGHLYVFLVYGMHHCANVVTRRGRSAEAVLLRAAEAPEGAPPRLLSGPGKLCAALGITTADSGLDLARRRPDPDLSARAAAGPASASRRASASITRARPRTGRSASSTRTRRRGVAQASLVAIGSRRE